MTAQLKPTRPIQSSTVSSSNNVCSNLKGEIQTLQNREYKLFCEHNNNFHGLPRSSADERQPVASSAIIQKKRPTQLKRWQSVNTHSDLAKGLNSGIKLLQKGSSSDQNNDQVVAKTSSGNYNFNSPQHLSGLVVSESQESLASKQSLSEETPEDRTPKTKKQPIRSSGKTDSNRKAITVADEDDDKAPAMPTVLIRQPKSQAINTKCSSKQSSEKHLLQTETVIGGKAPLNKIKPQKSAPTQHSSKTRIIETKSNQVEEQKAQNPSRTPLFGADGLDRANFAGN